MKTNLRINWKKKIIKLTDLYLDPDNIRLEIPNKSQDIIIMDLFANENTMQVLENIVKNGFFPDELPIVIKKGDRYIVLEGNRRVASLKAILNPSIAGKYETKITKLVDSVNPLNDIEVVVAPSREDANKLLANKHTVVTRKPWKPLRQAYFYHAQIEDGHSIEELIKEYPNVNIVSFVKMWEMHKVAKSIEYDSLEITKFIHDQRNFPVSTIERLYEDKNFREFVGFNFNQNGLLLIKAEPEEFKNILKQVFRDAVTGVIDTRSLNNEEARKKYYDKFDKPNPGKTETTSKIFTPQKIDKKKLSLKSNKLDTKGINFKLPFPAIKRMYIELENINIDDVKGFPNATHDLLRSFLECSLKAFFEIHNIPVHKTSHYTQLKDVLDTFINNPKVANIAGDKYIALKNLATQIQQTKGRESMREYTANMMNNINHNPHMFSDQKTVTLCWDTLKSLLIFVLETVPDEDNNQTTT